MLLSDMQGHILQKNPNNKDGPVYVQGLEENKANYLCVGSNYAFVIGRTFEAPLTSRQGSPVKSINTQRMNEEKKEPKICQESPKQSTQKERSKSKKKDREQNMRLVEQNLKQLEEEV